MEDRELMYSDPFEEMKINKFQGIDYPIILLSLQEQKECPACGMSWKDLEDCLNEGDRSPNYTIGQIIMANCKVCNARFGN